MRINPASPPRGEALPDPAPLLASVHRVPEAGTETRGYIGLDRNERVVPFPDWFIEKVRRSVSSELLTWYPSQDQLHRRLRENLGLKEEQLILTPSSDAAFKALYQTYVRPGDRVVMLDPSYGMFPVYAQMFGGEAEPVSYSRDLELDTAHLLESIVPGVRLIILANPNQPTSTVLDEKLLLEVIQRAAKIGAIVAMDEAYYGFYQGTALPWLESNPNLVVIRTFSKAAGLAGLRIGFVAAHPEVVHNLYKGRTVNDLNSMAVLCAELVLEHPEVVDLHISAVAEGGKVLALAATELGLTPLPTATNFMLLRVARRCHPAALVEALKSRGYLIKGPLDSACVEDCVRVTLGSAELMTEFAVHLREAVASASEAGA